MQNNIVNDVYNNNLCIGCGLCAAVAKNKIKIEQNSDGFVKPVVKKELNEVENNTIKKVCPGNVLDYSNLASSYDPIWGPIYSIYKGYATNEQIRKNGSSGGVISAFLDYLLKEKIVDYVIQIGQSKADPTLNEVYIHNNPKDVIKHSGSRYSPSSPLIAIDKVLKLDKKFAFVGKPCDISALRAYSSINPIVKKRIVYFFSFFCAGIPSTNGTLAVLNKLGVKQSKLSNIKYRGDGWPGNFVAKTKDNKKHTMTYNDSWGKVLNKHLHNRCKICPDGVGMQADIVCADAWETDEKGYPIFQEKSGYSLLISRTKHGDDLRKKAFNDKVIHIEKYEVEKLPKIQPYQYKRKIFILSRLIAMKVLGLKIPKYINLKLLNAAKKDISSSQIISFFGMVARIISKIRK